jgi:hypothetical protein
MTSRVRLIASCDLMAFDILAVGRIINVPVSRHSCAMKALLLASLLLLATLAHGEDTNNPARIKSGERWNSASRLERIAKDYVTRQKIQFNFEKTFRSVTVAKRGTNAVATICFSSGIGKQYLHTEIAPSGMVITNHVGIAICDLGGRP